MTRLLLTLLAGFWLTIQTNYDNSFSGSTKEVTVRRFDDKDELADYLASLHNETYIDGNKPDVYRVIEKVEFDVEVKKKDVERTTVETVETGRTVKFK